MILFYIKLQLSYFVLWKRAYGICLELLNILIERFGSIYALWLIDECL